MKSKTTTNAVEQTAENTQTIRRVRALIQRGDARGELVLVCNRIGTDYWYLPGGKLKFGEDAETGLIREMKEKTGREGRVCFNGFAGVCEHTYFDERRSAHIQETCFVFDFGFVGRIPKRVRSRVKGLRFKWVKADSDVKTLPLLPAHMYEMLGKWWDAAPSDPLDENIASYVGFTKGSSTK